MTFAQSAAWLGKRNTGAPELAGGEDAAATTVGAPYQDCSAGLHATTRIILEHLASKVFHAWLPIAQNCFHALICRGSLSTCAGDIELPCRILPGVSLPE